MRRSGSPEFLSAESLSTDQLPTFKPPMLLPTERVVEISPFRPLDEYDLIDLEPERFVTVGPVVPKTPLSLLVAPEPLGPANVPQPVMGGVARPVELGKPPESIEQLDPDLEAEIHEVALALEVVMRSYHLEASRVFIPSKGGVSPQEAQARRVLTRLVRETSGWPVTRVARALTLANDSVVRNRERFLTLHEEKDSSIVVRIRDLLTQIEHLRQRGPDQVLAQFVLEQRSPGTEEAFRTDAPIASIRAANAEVTEPVSDAVVRDDEELVDLPLYEEPTEPSTIPRRRQAAPSTQAARPSPNRSLGAGNVVPKKKGRTIIPPDVKIVELKSVQVSPEEILSAVLMICPDVDRTDLFDQSVRGPAQRARLAVIHILSTWLGWESGGIAKILRVSGGTPWVSVQQQSLPSRLLHDSKLVEIIDGALAAIDCSADPTESSVNRRAYEPQIGTTVRGIVARHFDIAEDLLANGSLSGEQKTNACRMIAHILRTHFQAPAHQIAAVLGCKPASAERLVKGYARWGSRNEEIVQILRKAEAEIAIGLDQSTKVVDAL